MPSRSKPGPSTAIADAGAIGELGEHAIIDRIRARVPQADPSVLIGIGDDGAVVRPERNAVQVLTTDALVEGIHFDWAFVTPREVGHKALAVNISDLAAMGASPTAALLSLVLPPAMPVRHLDELIGGLLDLAKRFKIDLVGGNIARSPGPLVVDVTLVGHAHPRRLLTRSGGRAGDVLYVSGWIGAAAAGLDALRMRGRTVVDDSPLGDCARRFLAPEPRLRLGSLLARNRIARCAVDLSDGLGDGIRQLAGSSRLGATIDADRIPVAPGARAWFEGRGLDAIEPAISGGEDYELLFSVAPRSQKALRAIAHLCRDIPVTPIGSFTADRQLTLERDGRAGPVPSGFAHFGG